MEISLLTEKKRKKKHWRKDQRRRLLSSINQWEEKVLSQKSMAPKRHCSLENGGGVESPSRLGGSKRRCCGRHDQGCTLHEFMEKLDAYDLQLVQQLCQKYLINVPHLSSRTRLCRLQFRNKLPDTLFTDRKFKAENNMEVEIVIVDASNKVISSGPMASAEIEIVVLDGDFHGDENGEWTKEEFEKHVIVARKDKRPLLIGNSSIKLCDGFTCITDAKFTDNSSWTKCKKFRLGVKLYGRIGMAGEVQEGISNAFRVKDRHGEDKQKDRPPSMDDEVYCLKGIFKNGPYHRKLLEYQINTVHDFLCYSRNNPERLRNMIDMPKGIWEKTLGHALKSKGWSDILLNGPINLPAPDQNSFEVTGSSSFQISNVLVQPNGVRQLPSYADCELPISDMSTSAQSLPASKLGFESKNNFNTTFITRETVWEGTEELDISLEVLMEGNRRSYVPNKLFIGSPSLRHKRIKILFVAILKVAAQVAARRSREISSPQWENLSPILTPCENRWFDIFANL